MRIFLVSLTLLASFTVANNAMAGTLSFSVSFPGANTLIDSSTGNVSFEISTGAVANSAFMHAFNANSGSVELDLRYERPTANSADGPPTIVYVSYRAETFGRLSYSLLARTPPSGSASGLDSGSVTRTGMPSITVSDSFGPVAQQTTYQGQSFLSQVKDCGIEEEAIPVSGWISTTEGSNTVYKKTLTISNADGYVSADCTVNWKTSNSMSSWTYINKNVIADFDVRLFPNP